MRKLVVLMYFLGNSLAGGGEKEFLAALTSYRDVQRADSSDVQSLESADRLLSEWKVLSDENKARWGDKIALVHFRKAQIYVGKGNYQTAAEELAAEVEVQTSFGGRLEYATKTPDSFFSELVVLQATVTAETGSDPLINKVRYLFERDRDGYTASRLELTDEISGLTVPAMDNGEAIALVYRIRPQSGKFVIASTRWLLVPKGEFPDVLKQATREVVFDSTGKMTVGPLQSTGTMPVEGLRDERGMDPRNATDERAIREPNPLPKASEVSPSGNEANSWIPWVVGISTVVVALGFSLLRLKQQRAK